jgi:hypothetical protein
MADPSQLGSQLRCCEECPLESCPLACGRADGHDGLHSCAHGHRWVEASEGPVVEVMKGSRTSFRATEMNGGSPSAVSSNDLLGNKTPAGTEDELRERREHLSFLEGLVAEFEGKRNKTSDVETESSPVAARRGYRWTCQAEGHGFPRTQNGSCRETYTAARADLKDHVDTYHGGSLAGTAIGGCDLETIAEKTA